MDTKQVKENMVFVVGLDWEPKLVGRGKMLTSPLTKNGWHIIPYVNDTSILPKEAIERVKQMQEAQFRIIGLLVAHELEVPTPKPEPAPEPPAIMNTDWIGDVAGLVGGILAFMAIGFAGLLVMGAVGALCGSDPVLIAVLDDGRWIEVYRWWE